MIVVSAGYSISVLNHRLISSAQKEDIEATTDIELQADVVHTVTYIHGVSKHFCSYLAMTGSVLCLVLERYGNSHNLI